MPTRCLRAVRAHAQHHGTSASTAGLSDGDNSFSEAIWLEYIFLLLFALPSGMVC